MLNLLLIKNVQQQVIVFDCSTRFKSHFWNSWVVVDEPMPNVTLLTLNNNFQTFKRKCGI